MSKEENQNGSIPKCVMNQLIEHTPGGFVLFYFNAENGSPENAITLDSPAHWLAVQKYIADWSIALNDINVQNIRSDIENAIMDNDPEESGDDCL